MPLYTSSQTTPGGIVVNAVLDTVTNTITYTATAPDGTVATSIQDTTAPGLRALSSQINFGRDITAGSQFIDAVNAVYNSVKKQETEAAAESKLTGEPPPNESAPIPVSPNTDPFEQTRIDAQNRSANAAPDSQTVINTETDPFEKARLEAVQKTTNVSPTEQDVIDAEQDPFERARLEAAQRTTRPQYEYPPDVSQDAAEDAKFNRQQSLANQPVTSPNPSPKGSAKGLVGRRLNTRKQATAQDNSNYNLLKDWRVRLSLAPGAKETKYLYWADKPGILAPLAATDGVVFPYTPQVQVNYTANYDPTELIHSNYKVYQYRSSSVDSISITCDFTAQDTREANYLLAVIHFFRSITKMFYGQDKLPVNGTPPPLCYLYGYGGFGFNKHPLAITNFTCNFPNDVDYIRATTHATSAGVNTSASNVPVNGGSGTESRTNTMGNLTPGGRPAGPQFTTSESTSNNTGGTVEPTYVPTKMQIQITAAPIISRNDISRRFSLEKYATGELLQGSKAPNGGGIW